MSDSLTAQDTYAALVGPPPVIGNDVPAPEKTRIALGALPLKPPPSNDAAVLAARSEATGEGRGRDPHSGAVNGWLDSTWIEQVQSAHPEMTAGKSPAEILAMRGDPRLDEEMRVHYNKQNSTTLEHLNLPVTPDTIQVMFRLGPGDGPKVLRAASVAPDMLVRDIVPAIFRQGGNMDVYNATAGQMVADPYMKGNSGSGPGQPGDPAALYRINKGMAESDRILSDLQKNLDADRARISGMAKDYKPFTPTPAPPPPDMDPLKHFGSVASIFAVLAAGLSKTPAVAAMNGLAGAIEGAQQHDWQKYQTEFRNWKQNTDYALDAHKTYSEDLSEALRMMQTDAATGNAMLQATLARTGDYENLMRQWREDPLKFQELQEHAVTARLATEKANRAATDDLELRGLNGAVDQAQQAVSVARSAGNQVEIAKAEDALKTKQAAVTNKLQQIESFNRAKLGGWNPRTGAGSLTAQQELQLMGDWDKQNPGASAEERAAAFNNIRARDTPADKAARADKAGTPAAVATRKYMEEHPDATAKEIQKFITDFKEDAPDVAARKDRQVAVQEKRAATAERTADIHAEYNKQKLQLDQDKFISAKERALRQDEEKARRDRALEDIYRARLVKAPTAAASKERDAEILAESNFTTKEGRAPTGSQEDLTKMAQLRTEARRTSSNEVISDEAADFTAERVLAGDERATVGMARSSANITKVTNHLVMKAKELNVSPRELAARIAEFMGTVAGERTLGIRTANMEIAAQEVAQFAPLVMQRSNAIDRSEYPDLNSLILAYERKTGSPDVVLFGQAVNSMVYAYAKFLNPTGVLTDADKTKAQEILNIAWTGGQFEATVKQIQMEIEFGQKAVGGVRQEFRQGFGGAVGTQQPPTQGPARISTDAEYNALPSGADFIGPDGKQRKKP